MSAHMEAIGIGIGIAIAIGIKGDTKDLRFLWPRHTITLLPATGLYQPTHGFAVLDRRGVRVVEGARLESVCRGNLTEGSNPSLSASCCNHNNLADYHPSMSTRLPPSCYHFKKQPCFQASLVADVETDR
jgi:hypothetical protein